MSEQTPQDSRSKKRAAQIAELNAQISRDTPLRRALKTMLRNSSARTGLIIIGFLIILFITAPIIATHDPLLSMIGIEEGRLPRKPPCIPLFSGQAYEVETAEGVGTFINILGADVPIENLGLFGCQDPLHYLGLDLNGRDVFSRVIWGTRQSLPVGFIAVSVSITVGTFLGLIAGFAGGWLDNLIMRVMDVLLAFPALLLAIAIVTILGPGLINALIAISIVAIPTYARLTRASVLSLKEQEFVLAVRALGASPARILFLQILPNALTPLIVQGTLGVGTAVLDAAALSFLGLGAQPPTPEWGQMLSEARSYVFTSPHMVFFPGFAIMLTVLGFNLLGDGMRDALDPRSSRD